MTIDQTVLQALKDRGLDLGPPVSSPDLEALHSKLSINPGRDFKYIYGLFNGFLVHDSASMLMLWDVKQIISHVQRYDGRLKGLQAVPIGDYLIESDIIVATVSDELAKVSLLFEERELAPSIEEFISLLVAGTFDFH